MPSFASPTVWLPTAEATELLAAAEETSERSRRQAQDAKVRLATLEATAGVEHKAVLAELEQLQDEARTKKRERQDLEELRRSLVRQIGVLTATVEQAEQDRIEAGERPPTRPTCASWPWPATASWRRRRWGAMARSTA